MVVIWLFAKEKSHRRENGEKQTFETALIVHFSFRKRDKPTVSTNSYARRRDITLFGVLTGDEEKCDIWCDPLSRPVATVSLGTVSASGGLASADDVKSCRDWTSVHRGGPERQPCRQVAAQRRSVPRCWQTRGTKPRGSSRPAIPPIPRRHRLWWRQWGRWAPSGSAGAPSSRTLRGRS